MTFLKITDQVMASMQKNPGASSQQILITILNCFLDSYYAGKQAYIYLELVLHSLMLVCYEKFDHKQKSASSRTLGSHLCKCQKNLPSFSPIYYPQKKPAIMMLMNTSRECWDFISFTSSSTNYTLTCSI